ncbi:PREDICTED: vitamin D3 hydroxylase-associated protein-like [Gekko japonicus]|uniref:Vitamin D3 hydroxylase-associated protein-like n=1 Tax=Gekko japonicus TaxID=146911 RepID=A0ABM1KUP4_GEKJA|nr:PREDICTED: vitamin D3 hydroxylase-associated protein-like [Gekko japonicus]
MQQEAFIVVHEWLKQLWPEAEIDCHVVLALTCGSAAAFLALKWVSQKRIKKQIQDACKKRGHGLEKMEKAVQKFKQQNPSVQVAHILSLPLVELTEKLREESLSPESVLYAYMGKALTVNQEVNCVRHFIPECEQHLQKLKRHAEKGLLYGVPVSIKDHIGYKGHLSTCGFTVSLGILEEEDSVLVKVLKRQGANPFVITNVPQSLMTYDCSNPIFGQTANPLNHRKSPGGSSGGEGALIAGGGSILGFGTDVGGSIRLPSSFCGLCGLKPTGSRLSNLGVRGPVDGILSVTLSLGPMARDVDSLVLCMKALLCDDMFQLDPTVPPMLFNEEIYSSTAPLRIGYYDTDGYFLLPPCMRRAVHETRKLLQEAGHTLVHFTPPSVPYVMDELFIKGLFADGGSTLLAMFGKDIIDPSLKHQVNYLRIPNLVKKGLAKIIKPWFPRLANHLNALCGVRSVKSLWEQHDKVKAYCKKFVDEWRKCKLDVVLCPVLGPAFTLRYPGKLLAAVSSTMLYNVLNFPAGVVPVTTVTEDDEEELQQYQGQCGDPWDKKLKKAVEGTVGLPVAVQCVALPWQEELCLRFMKEVETLSCKRRGKTSI